MRSAPHHPLHKFRHVLYTFRREHMMLIGIIIPIHLYVVKWVVQNRVYLVTRIFCRAKLVLLHQEKSTLIYEAH